MMENITFTFPKNTDSAEQFFSTLKSILTEAPHTVSSDRSFTFSAATPSHALPVISFRQDIHSDFPMWKPDFSRSFSPFVEKTIKSSYPNLGVAPLPHSVDPATIRRDGLGRYYKIIQGEHSFYRLEISEVQKRLEGHVKRVNHFGVNFSSKLLARADWDKFVHEISLNCNLYKYPTTSDWLFVIPTTIEEFNADITEFPIGRDPKFELVYDIHSSIPTFQFDIETDLNYEEAKKLFPPPYGISFPDLTNLFRTVYIYHEWGKLNIRFDIRFKSTDLANDWDTGKWLVTQGGRVRHDLSK